MYEKLVLWNSVKCRFLSCSLMRRRASIASSTYSRTCSLSNVPSGAAVSDNHSPSTDRPRIPPFDVGAEAKETLSSVSLILFAR